MANVVVENVYKIYPGDGGRDVSAVENASLEVRSGEFMVFVGPSGCGKSTTLRMIAGLEDISRGSVYIDGRRVNDVPPKDRDIAMVFQNYALYPHMNVYKNMAFGLQLRKFPKAEIDQRVREAAQILGLNEETLNRRPKALSGGQRQRVALGRAMVRKPKVFLFDEPLSNLDAKMRVQMRTEITKLHQRLGTTMIYVTHDQIEAMTMGDRICLMKDGRIQQVAEPLEIYHQPVNMFVAAFIGNPPMNFFKGSLLAHEGRIWFCEDVGTAADPSGRFALALEPPDAERLAGHLGRKIVLGLRPEAFCTASPTTGDQPVLAATVDMIEPMGAEAFIHLKTGSSNFIVRTPNHAEFQVGNRTNWVPDMARALFFDVADEALYRKSDGELDLERWQTACPRLR